MHTSKTEVLVKISRLLPINFVVAVVALISKLTFVLIFVAKDAVSLTEIIKFKKMLKAFSLAWEFFLRSDVAFHTWGFNVFAFEFKAGLFVIDLNVFGKFYACVALIASLCCHIFMELRFMNIGMTVFAKAP